MTNTITGWGWA